VAREGAFVRAPAYSQVPRSCGGSASRQQNVSGL
jgi:hypothetical protein